MSILTGLVRIACKGQTSASACSSTLAVEISGRPLNGGLSFTFLKSGMYCLPLWSITLISFIIVQNFISRDRNSSNYNFCC